VFLILNQIKTIDFKQVHLTKEDQEIMDLLQKQLHSNQLMVGNQKETVLLTNNKRYLILMPILAEVTIQLLQDSGNLQFINGKDKYKKVIFVENQLPISFELFQKNKSITLDILNLVDAYLDEYQWFVFI